MNLIYLISYAYCSKKSFSLSMERNALINSHREIENDESTRLTFYFVSSVIKNINGQIFSKSISNNIYEGMFVSRSLNLIQTFFLDKDKIEDTSDVLSILRNFPNLPNTIVKKKWVGISFFVIFVKFLFYTDEAVDEYLDLVKNFDSQKTIELYFLFDEYIKKRIELFLKNAKTLFMISDKIFWRISDCHDLYLKDKSTQIKEESKALDKFNELYKYIIAEEKNNDLLIICDDDLGDKTCISTPSTSTKIQYEDFKNQSFCSFSYLCLSPFCPPFAFLKGRPTDSNEGTNYNNALYTLGNNEEPTIPKSNTTKIPYNDHGFGKIVLDLLSLFTFVSCENFKISLSKNYDNVIIKYQLERNSLDFYEKKSYNDIECLFYLNKISHRNYQAYLIHDLCLETLLNVIDSIVNECNSVLKRNFERNLLIKRKGSKRFSQVIRRKSGENFINKRLSLKPTDDTNDLLEVKDDTLINLVYDFFALIDRPEIENFLTNKIKMNNNDYLLAYKSGLSTVYKYLLDLFITLHGCGYNENIEDEINILRNSLLNSEKLVKLINNSYDCFSESILQQNIYTLNSKKKVEQKLLSCIALYNDKQKVINYESMISLRQHLRGILEVDNLSKDLEFIMAKTIINTIELNKIKMSLIVQFSKQKLYKLCKSG